jgi:hypothetical protein
VASDAGEYEGATRPGDLPLHVNDGFGARPCENALAANHSAISCHCKGCGNANIPNTQLPEQSDCLSP